MRVNVLPVLTYNFLHVNDSYMELSDIDVNKEVLPGAGSLPAGVTYKKQKFTEAGEIFAAVKDRALAADESLDGPNADTSVLHTSQAVRTGMGAEVDNLMISEGVMSDVYTVEQGCKASEPIVIKRELKDGGKHLASMVIHACKDSEAIFVIDNNSDKRAGGLLGTSTRILAEDGAKITLCLSQTLGDGFIHFEDIGGICLDGSSVDLISLELGAAKNWNGCYMNLAEKETVFNSNMGYLCRDDHSLDINYVADQRGKKTDAHMDFKGVLMDNATKCFRGTLDFKSGSSGSVGDEQEDALLLSPDVVNKTMPVILCQEEDVEGRHGATIGQLGDDILFYMQTRGIDEQEARRIMVRARLDSVSRLIPNPHVMQRIQYFIQNVL